jgi:hypothetical protein
VYCRARKKKTKKRLLTRRVKRNQRKNVPREEREQASVLLSSMS